LELYSFADSSREDPALMLRSAAILQAESVDYFAEGGISLIPVAFIAKEMSRVELTEILQYSVHKSVLDP
jgi:hypothetical protein